MFRLTIVGLALASSVGCHKYKMVRCDQPAGPECPPVVTAPPQVVAAPGPPQVEVKQAPVVEVKAPPAKVTVNMPPPQTVNAPGAQMGFPGQPGCGPQACGPQGPGCAPQMGMAPMPQQGFAPQMAMAPVGFAPVAQHGVTETITRPRTRIALGLDRVRISLPVPKLFALPTEHETTTRTRTPALAPVGFAPVAQPQMAFAPVAAAPQMAMAPVVPAAAPQMAFAPAPQMAPQMAFAPAPQMAFAPAPQMAAPQMAPQMAFAPAPAPQMYAPPPVQYMQQGYVQPTMNGVICVPGPAQCQPGCQPGCETQGMASPMLLDQINKLDGKLDAMEQQHRAAVDQQQRMWKASQVGGAAAVPLHGPRPVAPGQ